MRIISKNQTSASIFAQSWPKISKSFILVTLFCAYQSATAGVPVQTLSGEIPNSKHIDQSTKPVVYQVFTRLFGNKNSNNQPWGTIEENGVGKFSDFDDIALKSIQSLGVTHIWYTGVPHHALIRDYSLYGIGNDDPDVVKGRAGSPYAVKDYYNVNPDLADNPANRLNEFKALIERTHQHGIKVIIDIVPNHVARRYESTSMPAGIENFGAFDNTQVEYAKNNHFYYVTDASFQVPDLGKSKPLGGETHPLNDGQFDEFPAKWTGNGSRLAKPDANDWYETVKINYGVKPDGSHDFPTLPKEYAKQDVSAHYLFWQSIDEAQLPDSWVKFKQITDFWLSIGVDGFRYDMAEMVPVEFWSYLNSNIKQINPDAFLLAEVYNPALFRDYIHLGKMDYLYDKVDLYDTLKAIIQGKKSTSAIETDRLKVADIASHMLHFLENHDEQRISSPEFAGDPFAALPAMVVSASISKAPTLIYFGQEVGEDGSENPGFGAPSRTSIFDYIGVPAHQRYMNDGKFDGGQSTRSELALRNYYARLLNLSHTAPALLGEYYDLDTVNRAHRSEHLSQAHRQANQMGQSDSGSESDYDEMTFAFARFSQEQQLMIVSNFSRSQGKAFTLKLPADLIAQWQVKPGHYPLKDLLAEPLNQPLKRLKTHALVIDDTGSGSIGIKLKPLESKILSLRPESYQWHNE
ncbi:alpha-amylase family protein [Shewanella sp. YLB-07]|uniref:alpha-amylase family protein n=1 Tax=Shewanella sp. YLB-07 TaxID=2601268 RepID=UPI00128AF9DD|nr:alpha-amylase family protein [Shewanella sp. YLB-07]MPY24639.1 alpha-amylase [Shewanella sp. YLB-07]